MKKQPSKSTHRLVGLSDIPYHEFNCVTMPRSDILTAYESACHGIVREFIMSYFVDKDIKLEDIDYFQVSDQCDETLCINDYYFSFDNIVTSLCMNATKAQLFDYYDEALENYALPEKKRKLPNFENYLRGFIPMEPKECNTCIQITNHREGECLKCRGTGVRPLTKEDIKQLKRG